MNTESETLVINNKEVVVAKLTLRKIAGVFKALENLPKIFNDKFADKDITKIPNSEIVQMLPTIVGEAMPEVAKLISLGSTLSEDEVLDELGLNDAIEVLVAIFKVNDFSKVVDNVKKLAARKQPEENKK